MSFVGKVLIFVQVVLSICFMAFAGAVFATHQNWKAKYEQAQTSVQQAQGELNTARQQLETVRDEASRQVKAAEDRANEAEQRNVTLLAQVDQERRKNNRLEQELATQTGIARTKSDEAAFRQQEAEQQRVLNKSLHASLDEATTQLRTIQDELFSQKLAFEQLQARFNELLEEKAFLQQIVKLNNLETDPQAVAAMQEPAPPSRAWSRKCSGTRPTARSTCRFRLGATTACSSTTNWTCSGSVPSRGTAGRSISARSALSTSARTRRLASSSNPPRTASLG